MAKAYEQLSLLSKEESAGQDCAQCRFFAELKEPFKRSDGAVIYGYCFKDGDTDSSLMMGKGYAVFLLGGHCKRFKRKRREAGKT